MYTSSIRSMPMEQAPVTGRTARAVRREVTISEREQKPAKSMVDFHFDRLLAELRAALAEIEPDEKELLNKWNRFFSADAQSSEVFGQVISEMRLAIAKHPKEGKRGVNPESPEWRPKINQWIDALRSDMVTLDVPVEAQAGVRYEGVAFMEAAAATLTAEAFIDEIDSFEAREAVALAKPETRAQAILRLQAKLEKEFAYTPEDIQAIVRLKLPEVPVVKSDVKQFVDILNIVWKEYGMENHRNTIARLALGSVVSSRINAYLPNVKKDFVKDDVFQLDVYLTSLAVEVGKAGIQGLSEDGTDQIQFTLNTELNRRMVDSLFFRRSEFSPSASDQDMLRTLGEGKQGIHELVRLLYRDLLPAATSMGMSLYALTKLHPLLGLIGVGGLPLLGLAAKEEGKVAWGLSDTDRKRQRNLGKKLSFIKDGMDQLRVSEAAGDKADDITKTINEMDSFDKKTPWERVRQRVKANLPRVMVDAGAACVGYGLQRLGVVKKGSDVLEQIELVKNMRRPVEELLEMYHGSYKEAVGKIQRMRDMLGKPEDLDGPDGPREKARVSFSSLPHADITLENLWFKNVLRGATERIQAGEFVLLIGKSGSGKSTILKQITDLQPPEYGEVRIGDVPVSEIKKYGPDSLYAAMAYANQAPQIFPEMSVRENVTLWIPHLERTDEEVKSVLKELGLDKFADRLDTPLNYASGGETLRFGLARALIKRPKILLLDEPTASLDPDTAREAWELLQTMHEKDPSLTIICVTHSEGLIDRFEKSDPGARRKVIRVDEIHAA